jgi:serine/threonine protein phosphatase PrpC
MLSQSAWFTVETGAASDTGCVRDHNEDAFMARPDSGVWLVADGMGGHDAGDFASRTIAEEMLSIGLPISSADLQARFMERLNRAHARIRQHAAELGGVTVGATVVGLLIHEDSYACLWAGDSRIYRMRDGVLAQQTLDHTEVRQLLDAGIITPEEAESWPRRNVITRAIGVMPEADVDVVSDGLQAGDMFLMCSDGLTEHNSDADIAAALMGAPSAQDACDALVAQTIQRGARDNVTVMVVRCHPAEAEGAA